MSAAEAPAAIRAGVPSTLASSERAIDYALASLFFYLPLAVPLHLPYHHFIGRYLGTAELLFFPESLVILAVSAALLARYRQELSQLFRRERPMRAIYAAAAAYLGWGLVCGAIQGWRGEHFIRWACLGWILPMLLGLAVAVRWSDDLASRIQDSLFSSGVVLSCVAVVAYVLSFSWPRDFNELVFVNRTYKVHWGRAGGIIFGDMTFGSMNSLAAILSLIFILRLPALYKRSSAGTIPGLGVILLAEWLCFSRGAIVVLFLGTIAFIIVSGAGRSRALLPAVLLLGCFGAAVFGLPGAISYWKGQVTAADSSSARFRLELWKNLENPEATRKLSQGEIPTLLRAPGGAGLGTGTGTATAVAPARLGGGWRLLFGYGPGNYGLNRGLTAEARTHSIFLDAFVDGGLPGALAFSGLFALVAARRVRFAVRPESAARRLRESALLAGIVGIGFLGLAVDYPFENIGSMMGGALFWYLAVASRPSLASPAAASERPRDHRADASASG